MAIAEEGDALPVAGAEEPAAPGAGTPTTAPQEEAAGDAAAEPDAATADVVPRAAYEHMRRKARRASRRSVRNWRRFSAERRRTRRLKRQVAAARRSARIAQRANTDPLLARVAMWARLAQCESGGRWHVATGNGFHGGIQFHPMTWRAFGGSEFAPYAHWATPLQQIAIAERVLDGQGRHAWPHCGVVAGLG